ncbi:hypothetical protein F2Q70_00044242 [Brassica cretica]|uniref:F-box domain-containing protein n=1 Tax=Brassica cretica TaxID=69181 RepID=A0A8S9KHY2_BRACR|nr:hypothetical protein F2Q70_00044242 [Brassica cretica]
MKTRSSDVQGANRGKRKAPEGDENGRGKRRSVQSDEQKKAPQIGDYGRGKKRLAPSNEQKKGKKILRGIRSCVSPRCSASSTHRPSFFWFEQDAWTYISRFLDGKSLVMLGATSKWFHKTVMEESIWRFACLRDLQVPRPFPVSSSWNKIYASTFAIWQFSGSQSSSFAEHSFILSGFDTVITDWMRIGAFTLDSRMSLLTESLSGQLKVPRVQGTIEQMLQSTGSCIIKDIKSGIWIADLQLVRCPVCDLSTCDATSKWFHKTVMEESIWRFACLRDLQVPRPFPVSSSWNKIYASTFAIWQFSGSQSSSFAEHSFILSGFDTVITDWMRIGAFTLDSRMSLLTESLSGQLKVPRVQGTIEQMLQSTGSCIIKDIKTGIWIADLQLVRCPVCDLSTCDGTMQTLDTRHIELFLNEEYKDGSWDYNLIGSHKLQKDTSAACGAIFDLKHLKASSSSGIFHLKSWTGEPEDSQPKAFITTHAVAVHTRLQKNEGILVKYQTMKAGIDGDIVAIRISQQLL